LSSNQSIPETPHEHEDASPNGKDPQYPDDTVVKARLIRKIQLAEGNFDCYGSASNSDCDQLDCAWRGDCLSESVAASGQAQ